MAFYSGSKTNQNLVFGDKGEIGNSSFAYSEAATVASTVNKIANTFAGSSYFGRSVAVGNGRIVVGGEDDAEAYIYDMDGTKLATIRASDRDQSDFFGRSVAVGNGRIVVGSYGDDDYGTDSGAAYIFDLDGNELAKLTASDAATNDEFGQSVAVGCGRIVVGARRDDDNGSNSGSAYIFDLDGTQLAKITPSDGAGGHQFGVSVAVGNGRIVVGSHLDTEDGSNSGSAYIFDLDGNQLTKITASDGDGIAFFGSSVAIGNGRIVIGANGDYINGNSKGSVYIFDLDGNELNKITASDGSLNDKFGESVAVGSGRIVVGAIGDQDNGVYSGSVYIFDLDGNQLAKITAPDGAAYDYFGQSVAIGSGRIVVGAWGDDGYYGSIYTYNTNEYYDDYVEKIADNRIGQYTRLTG